jgi:hypothetical protein
MAKEDLIETHGKVDEVLPDSRYRVSLDNGHCLVAYTAGRMRRPLLIGRNPVAWLARATRRFHRRALRSPLSLPLR